MCDRISAATRRFIVAAFYVLTAGTFDVKAAEGVVDISGFLAGELRAFPHAPAHSGQSGAVLAPSMVLQPEFRYRWNDGDDRLTMIPFARFDGRDSERSHFDLRELNWLHVGDGWDLVVGMDKVFWGVTESRHLVDIVNQTDLVENIDGEDKLGQPMINLDTQRGWGNLNFFVMSGFRERTFAGKKGRLRGATVVDTDQAVYVGDAGRRSVDLAVRYSAVLGDWDIGLAHFHGTGREPRLVAGVDAIGARVFVPHYDTIDQTSLDVQATLGDWLWKLEAIGRSGQGDTFAAVVGGFEFTLYGIFGSYADLGLLVEYLYDGRDDAAPATSSDDDFFTGLRFALNDRDDTNFLAGVIVDRRSGGRFFSVEADTRLSDHWTIEVESRVFSGLPESDPNSGIRRDDYIQIRLVRYF